MPSLCNTGCGILGGDNAEKETGIAEMRDKHCLPIRQEK